MLVFMLSFGLLLGRGTAIRKRNALVNAIAESQRVGRISFCRRRLLIEKRITVRRCINEIEVG